MGAERGEKSARVFTVADKMAVVGGLYETRSGPVRAAAEGKRQAKTIGGCGRGGDGGGRTVSVPF